MGMGLRSQRWSRRLDSGLLDYWTTNVSVTDRVRPALVAATVIGYVPVGVATVGGCDPVEGEPGISRPAPQPVMLRALSNKMNAIRVPRYRFCRKLLRTLEGMKASGMTSTHHTERGCGAIVCAAEGATPVSIVAVRVADPPRGTLAGTTTHVELVGAPVQVRTASPGRPAGELSRSGYTADAPLLTVTLVAPFAFNEKSTPTP